MYIDIIYMYGWCRARCIDRLSVCCNVLCIMHGGLLRYSLLHFFCKYVERDMHIPFEQFHNIKGRSFVSTARCSSSSSSSVMFIEMASAIPHAYIDRRSHTRGKEQEYCRVILDTVRVLVGTSFDCLHIRNLERDISI